MGVEPLGAVVESTNILVRRFSMEKRQLPGLTNQRNTEDSVIRMEREIGWRQKKCGRLGHLKMGIRTKM